MDLVPSKAARIEVVDSLRGFAVFGILVSHCAQLFFLGEPTKSTGADEAVGVLVRLFVNDKFYSLFSFLFGLSFSLMLSRSGEAAARFYGRYAWRLILLGAIGVLHNLHWNDDILGIYAVLGFGLLLVSRLDDRIVLTLAFLLLANLPSVVLDRVLAPLTPEEIAAQRQAAATTYDAFYEAMKHGSYLDTVRANLSVFPYKLQYYLYSGRFGFMFGFFLLGLVAGRRKLFQAFDMHRTTFWRVLAWTGVASVLLTLAAFIVLRNRASLAPELKPYLSQLLHWQSHALTLTYASGMALLFASARSLAGPFAAVGRMALTNYVLHSVLGTLLLCGYGLGLINLPIPIAIATLCALPLFAVMIAFSRFWMARFAFGPLEWLWRTATRFEILPIRRA